MDGSLVKMGEGYLDIRISRYLRKNNLPVTGMLV